MTQMLKLLNSIVKKEPLNEDIYTEIQVSQRRIEAAEQKLLKVKSDKKELMKKAGASGPQSGILPQYRDVIKRADYQIAAAEQDLMREQARIKNLLTIRDKERQQPAVNKISKSHEEKIAELRKNADEYHESVKQSNLSQGDKAKNTRNAWEKLLADAKKQNTTPVSLIKQLINELTLNHKKPLDISVLAHHFKIPPNTMLSWLRQLNLRDEINLIPSRMGIGLPSQYKKKDE